jgi:hypothetical protein
MQKQLHPPTLAGAAEESLPHLECYAGRHAGNARADLAGRGSAVYDWGMPIAASRSIPTDTFSKAPALRTAASMERGLEQVGVNPENFGLAE